MMTTVILRWTLLLMVCLVVTGCSLPTPTGSGSEEVELFALGLDEYLAYGDLTSLKRLPQQYPQGEWRPRAEGVIDMAKAQAKLEEKDRELASCQKDKDALAQDILVLEETLEQLKEVLIDTEQRMK